MSSRPSHHQAMVRETHEFHPEMAVLWHPSGIEHGELSGLPTRRGSSPPDSGKPVSHDSCWPPACPEYVSKDIVNSRKVSSTTIDVDDKIGKRWRLDKNLKCGLVDTNDVAYSIPVVGRL